VIAAEEQLDGGIANAGQVVRVGPHVLRPSSPHSGSIHAFLQAVRHAGFDGAPAPAGIDEDGRERLVFIEGDVPVTGMEKYDRRRRWWTDHHDDLAAALH
jgi:hypothetical protein